MSLKQRFLFLLGIHPSQESRQHSLPEPGLFVSRFGTTAHPTDADLMRIIHWRFAFKDGSVLDVHHYQGGCRFTGQSYLFYGKEGELVMEVPVNQDLRFSQNMSAVNDPTKIYIPFSADKPRRRSPRA